MQQFKNYTKNIKMSLAGGGIGLFSIAVSFVDASAVPAIAGVVTFVVMSALKTMTQNDAAVETIEKKSETAPAA
ncbi:hypothetical protein bpr_II048 (plasmid) [Butyrivibrio proteoclasticus B316]|uniref:Uncharacterized protein n=1 Tax=Butyrivibrio proteoclasticus (strain ATCC 51982 / DSM 14932 / B316) TaxID=515622 RepID=E0S3K6_BUTPB|nr:hypothetical protein [Butyrivibrio proteoclasticus]ADL35988.1 hypothetical protein bpr_II048 [Butyrivibrio proteoclasticus B316]